MAFLVLILLALAFATSTISYLSLNKKHRDVVLDRFHLRKRRFSGAATPPRSLSPEKKAPEEFPDCRTIFPPSRRGTLALIDSKLPLTLKNPLSKLIQSPVDLRRACVPLETPMDEVDKLSVTPTEFTIDEVKALGDFPDYATLSGVPLPEPYREFDIKTALPRPYRPFRWAYHQTMSLTKMEPDWWLELEKSYPERIRQRQELFKQHGSQVLQHLPGSELACKELMEMALQFLCARYPHYFSLSADKTIFYNGILNTESHLKTTHPLHILLDNVPEDFAIMLRDPQDGYYRFRAGVICSALGWDVTTKIGMRLHEIHAPIPDYKEKMQFSMDRYFAKKPTDKPIQRGSWGLEVHTPLFCPPDSPHLSLREAQDPSLTISDINLRVDWQTLRRLPLSAAVVFNFKALFTPVTEFRDEPYIPALVLKVLREGKKNMMEYKGTWHVEHVVLERLEEWKREQERGGVVEEGWEERTLDESPWFPGWEGKWRGQQGF